MAQIGTHKITDTDASGNVVAVSLPIFNLGDSSSGVYEIFRTETTDSRGFVPFTNPTDAAYPDLRINTDSYGTLAAHDSTSPGTGGVSALVDDFEDGDVNEYQRSDSLDFRISTSSYEGTYAVEVDNADTDGPSEYGYSLPGDGLNYYPQEGDTVEYYIRSESRNDLTATVFIGLTEQSYSSGGDLGGNAFHVQLDWDDGRLGVANPSGDSSDEYFSVDDTTWYRIVARWNVDISGIFEAEVFDSGTSLAKTSVSAEENSFERGIGFKTSSVGGNRYEYYVDSIRTI